MAGTAETYDWSRPEGLLAALNSTPLAELEWRAAIVTELSGTEGSFASATRSYRVGNATRYADNDSGGSSTVLYVTDDGRALLITFNCDSDLNPGFADWNFATLREYYRGVPDDLMHLASDRTAAYENHGPTDPGTGAFLIVATGVCWFDGREWHLADGLVDFCEAEGLNLAYESGLTVGTYALDEEFTPETYFEHNLQGSGLTAAEITDAWDCIRTAFQRRPRP